MQDTSAAMIARIGAVAILASLLVSWFGYTLGPIKIDFSVWDSGKPAGYALIAVGVAALLQPVLASPALMARFWMLAGVGLAAYLGYRISSPPKDAADELLSALNLSMKPRIGIFLAIGGSAAIAFGAWLEMQSLPRSSSVSTPINDRIAYRPPAGAAAAPAGAATVPAVGQTNSASIPQPAAMTAAINQPRQIAPDPFAPKPPAGS